ncbi:MAG: DUF4870 domain-containing protein [Anaerolineales bacterium]|nr:DUF4870 domain-containing protein [Anaerolineales bacterium]
MSTEISPASADFQSGSGPAAAVSGDERTWATLAHWTILLNLVTGFLGPIAALIVYFMYRDRSRYVSYHAMQSFVFQLITWYGGGLLVGLVWSITGLLSIVLVGLFLIPIACVVTAVIGLLPVGGLVYSVWAGLETNQGKDFKYWLVGDWVRGTLTG